MINLPDNTVGCSELFLLSFLADLLSKSFVLF